MTTSTKQADVFLSAINFILDEIETDACHHRPGSSDVTRWGVCRLRYPHLNVCDLPRDTAIEIHRVRHWNEYLCGDLPPALAVYLLDGLICHKPKTAVRLLQMTLQITADGFIGPRTISTARSAANMTSYPELLAQAFALRADFIHDMITADSRQARFGLMRFKRLFLLQQYIAQMTEQ